MEEDNKEILCLLGDKLRACRVAKDLSQEEVSFDAKIHRTYLSQIELGERNPSFLVLVQICNSLEINLADVIKEVMGQIKQK